MMTSTNIKQCLGTYNIYIHKEDKDYDINLLDPNTTGTYIGAEVCSTCDSKHKYQKIIGKSHALTSCIDTKF